MAGDDRFTNLPDNVVDQILKNLPLPEAVRTSLLSRAWRYKWTTIPHLVFDYFQLSSLCSNICSTEFIISHLLNLHQGPIFKFSLLEIDDDVSHQSLNSWLQLLSNHHQSHLEDLEVGFLTSETHYELPHLVFTSFDNLRRLSLKNVDIIELPPAIQDFSVLVKLHLENVTIDNVELQRIISQCQVLEFLTFVLHDFNFYSLDINAPNLKVLRLESMFCSISLKTPSLEDLYIGYSETYILGDEFQFGDIEIPESDESNLIKVFGHLPLLRKFESSLLTCQFLAVGGVPDELPSKLYNLTHVRLDDIDFGVFYIVTCVLCLIRNSPNLESLDLHFGTCNESLWPRNLSTVEQREHERHNILKFLKAIRKNGIILDHLSSVSLSGCSGYGMEEELVKLLLLTVAGNIVQKFEVRFNYRWHISVQEAIVDELKRFHQQFSERVPMEIS